MILKSVYDVRYNPDPIPDLDRHQNGNFLFGSALNDADSKH
jgi:hypothetical protein